MAALYTTETISDYIVMELIRKLLRKDGTSTEYSLLPPTQPVYLEHKFINGVKKAAPAYKRDKKAYKNSKEAGREPKEPLEPESVGKKPFISEILSIGEHDSSIGQIMDTQYKFIALPNLFDREKVVIRTNYARKYLAEGKVQLEIVSSRGRDYLFAVFWL